jgi:hypothetical protein
MNKNVGYSVLEEECGARLDRLGETRTYLCLLLDLLDDGRDCLFLLQLKHDVSASATDPSSHNDRLVIFFVIHLLRSILSSSAGSFTGSIITRAFRH